MAQANRRPVAPPRKVRANDWGPMGGPVLPGESRPLAPVPAASDSGEPPYLPERELLRQLVRYYRWAHVGAGVLRRYNPHGRSMEALVGGQDDA